MAFPICVDCKTSSRWKRRRLVWSATTQSRRFWTEFASQNPSPVPFRLCLNGKKSPVLKSTQLWFDFAGFVKGQIAQIGVEARGGRCHIRGFLEHTQIHVTYMASKNKFSRSIASSLEPRPHAANP